MKTKSNKKTRSIFKYFNCIFNATYMISLFKWTNILFSHSHRFTFNRTAVLIHIIWFYVQRTHFVYSIDNEIKKKSRTKEMNKKYFRCCLSCLFCQSNVCTCIVQFALFCTCLKFIVLSSSAYVYICYLFIFRGEIHSNGKKLLEAVSV